MFKKLHGLKFTEFGVFDASYYQNIKTKENRRRRSIDICKYARIFQIDSKIKIPKFSIQ